MPLFAHDSPEAATYHTCRSTAEGAAIDTDQLAMAGAYAASLAWHGHTTQHGRPETFEHACHIAVGAADAFINATAKDRDIGADEVSTAKERAGERVRALLRNEFS